MTPCSQQPGRALRPERALSGSAAAASEQQESIRVLSRYRALLLDATYRPVGVANWQR
jgi:hypothetical protein